MGVLFHQQQRAQYLFPIFITTSPQLQLDGENVVFGNVVEGLDIIKRVENDVATDEDDCPLQKIFILDCGEVLKSVAV